MITATMSGKRRAATAVMAVAAVSARPVAKATGAITVYQLVMPEEADAEKGLISTSSPIGRAILNKEVGDAINVTTPSGKRNFELVKLTTIYDE